MDEDVATTRPTSTRSSRTTASRCSSTATTSCTEQPTTMQRLLRPAPRSTARGPHEPDGRAEEVVPLALMALGPRPEHRQAGRPRQAPRSCCSRSGRASTTITSSNYIDDGVGRQDHPRPGLERRRAAHLAGPQEAGRHHRRACRDGHVGALGRQLVHPRQRAAIRWPRTRGSTTCCDPAVAGEEMKYHNYAIPIRRPRSQDAEGAARTTRCSTCPRRTPNDYEFILQPDARRS